MAVSQAPAAIDTPLTIAIQGAGGSEPGSGTPGTLVVSEIVGQDATSKLAVMATSFQAPPDRRHEQLAIDALLEAVTGAGSQHLSDVMKTGFREANKAVYAVAGESASEGVGMLALATRGKYATLALVGHDRAYLARAGRLNQLTRDQRVVRTRSRRKQDIEAAEQSGPQVRLIGEADRLDSKSPAIFEIVLLPEDRLAVLSSDLIEMLGEDAILAGLQQGQTGQAGQLVASGSDDPASAMMAAVLSVAPVREAAPVYSQPAGPVRSIWMIIIPVVLLLAIFAAVAYFLL